MKMPGMAPGANMAMRSSMRTPKMSLVKPNYSQRSPIVNDAHFTDGPPEPTLESAQASYNPGQTASQFPSGPPRFVQAPGKRTYAGRGMGNKRIPGNL